MLVDGGTRHITLLASAFAAGTKDIYVLMASRIHQLGDGLIPRSAAEIQLYDQRDRNFPGTKVNGLNVLTQTSDLL